MDMGLKGRTVIVTGASSSIGRGILLGFAAEGAQVVAAQRDEEAGGRAVAEANRLGGEAICVRDRRHRPRLGRGDGAGDARPLRQDRRAREQRGRHPGRGEVHRQVARGLGEGDPAQLLGRDQLHARGARRHDRAPLGPHREHHLGLGGERSRRRRPRGVRGHQVGRERAHARARLGARPLQHHRERGVAGLDRARRSVTHEHGQLLAALGLRLLDAREARGADPTTGRSAGSAARATWPTRWCSSRRSARASSRARCSRSTAARSPSRSSSLGLRLAAPRRAR